MATDSLSTIFAALADPTRRAILARLVSGEASVTELAGPFEMSMPAITKHLKVLERAGLIARGRDAQGEAAVDGEAVEGAPTRVAARGRVVLALVEERARLLASERRDAEAHAVLRDFQLARLFAVEYARLCGQPFERAHAYVVALDDGARRELFDQKLHERRLQSFRALRERLQDEHVGVSINDDGRQEIAL